MADRLTALVRRAGGSGERWLVGDGGASPAGLSSSQWHLRTTARSSHPNVTLDWNAPEEAGSLLTWATLPSVAQWRILKSRMEMLAGTLRACGVAGHVFAWPQWVAQPMSWYAR